MKVVEGAHRVERPGSPKGFDVHVEDEMSREVGVRRVRLAPASRLYRSRTAENKDENDETEKEHEEGRYTENRFPPPQLPILVAWEPGLTRADFDPAESELDFATRINSSSTSTTRSSSSSSSSRKNSSSDHNNSLGSSHSQEPMAEWRFPYVSEEVKRKTVALITNLPKHRQTLLRQMLAFCLKSVCDRDEVHKFLRQNLTSSKLKQALWPGAAEKAQGKSPIAIDSLHVAAVIQFFGGYEATALRFMRHYGFKLAKAKIALIDAIRFRCLVLPKILTKQNFGEFRQSGVLVQERILPIQGVPFGQTCSMEELRSLVQNPHLLAPKGSFLTAGQAALDNLEEELEKRERMLMSAVEMTSATVCSGRAPADAVAGVTFATDTTCEGSSRAVLKMAPATHQLSLPDVSGRSLDPPTRSMGSTTSTSTFRDNLHGGASSSTSQSRFSGSSSTTERSVRESIKRGMRSTLFCWRSPEKRKGSSRGATTSRTSCSSSPTKLFAPEETRRIEDEAQGSSHQLLAVAVAEEDARSECETFVSAFEVEQADAIDMKVDNPDSSRGADSTTTPSGSRATSSDEGFENSSSSNQPPPPQLCSSITTMSNPSATPVIPPPTPGGAGGPPSVASPGSASGTTFFGGGAGGAGPSNNLSQSQIARIAAGRVSVSSGIEESEETETTMHNMLQNPLDLIASSGSSSTSRRRSRSFSSKERTVPASGSKQRSKNLDEDPYSPDAVMRKHMRVFLAYDGHPVEYWQIKHLFLDQMFLNYSEEEVQQAYMNYLEAKERLLRATGSRCTTLLLDCTGVTFSQMTSSMRYVNRFVKACLTIGDTYYPDSVQKSFVLNTPFVAPVKMTIACLAQSTRESVRILGKGGGAEADVPAEILTLLPLEDFRALTSNIDKVAPAQAAT